MVQHENPTNYAHAAKKADIANTRWEFHNSPQHNTFNDATNPANERDSVPIDKTPDHYIIVEAIKSIVEATYAH